jgi:nitroreductase
MFHLFDAPVLLLVTIDKAINLEYAMLDVGLFLQTFSLLAHNKGLGSCPLAVSVRHPELLRSHFSIPDTRLIVIGAAVGWPDDDAPVNRFGRKRAASEELVRWIR